jgi:hypothetical protein
MKGQKLGGSDDFSATPAEICAADPKGRRHFLFFLVLFFLVLDWRIAKPSGQ